MTQAAMTFTLTGPDPLMSGMWRDLDANGNTVTNLKAPVAANDAARKADVTAVSSSLAPVATSGAYADLTGKPTLGTAAALNTGTSNGNIPVLGASGLPAVGGSLLTGLTKAQVSLGNVDNTSDSAKPISVLQQAALDLKATTSALGTAAYLNTGTASGNIPLLGASGLPAVGGSLLTGLTKTQVSLANVDNTSDANKPVSTATQAALDAKAALNSPVLVTPTLSAHPAVSDNTLKIPSTKWVNDAVAGAVASGVADGDKGDIVVSGTGTIWSIDSGTAASLRDRSTHTGTILSTVVSDFSTAADARISASVGVSVQAYDPDLTTWSGITPAAGVGTFLATPTSANLRAALTDETGTGAAVFATSPTLVTPALGTPASGVMTNVTGLPTTGLVDNSVTNAKAAQMPANTFKGNNTGSPANAADLTKAQMVTALDAAQLSVEDQVLAGGVRITAKHLGNLSGASITPDPGDRPIQKITNNGAGSILPGSNYGAYSLVVANASGAGAITTTGWTVKGDAFDTTTTSRFHLSCIVTADIALMVITKVV